MLAEIADSDEECEETTSYSPQTDDRATSSLPGLSRSIGPPGHATSSTDQIHFQSVLKEQGDAARKQFQLTTMHMIQPDTQKTTWEATDPISLPSDYAKFSDQMPTSFGSEHSLLSGSLAVSQDGFQVKGQNEATDIWDVAPSPVDVNLLSSSYKRRIHESSSSLQTRHNSKRRLEARSLRSACDSNDSVGKILQSSTKKKGKTTRCIKDTDMAASDLTHLPSTFTFAADASEGSHDLVIEAKPPSTSQELSYHSVRIDSSKPLSVQEVQSHSSLKGHVASSVPASDDEPDEEEGDHVQSRPLGANHQSQSQNDGNLRQNQEYSTNLLACEHISSDGRSVRRGDKLSGTSVDEPETDKGNPDINGSPSQQVHSTKPENGHVDFRTLHKGERRQERRGRPRKQSTNEYQPLRSSLVDANSSKVEPEVDVTENIPKSTTRGKRKRGRPKKGEPKKITLDSEPESPNEKAGGATSSKKTKSLEEKQGLLGEESTLKHDSAGSTCRISSGEDNFQPMVTENNDIDPSGHGLDKGKTTLGDAVAHEEKCSIVTGSSRQLSTKGNESKPLFRVGLSKRTRIAPLLKIIRK